MKDARKQPRAPQGASLLLADLRRHHPPSWRHSLRVSIVARELALAYGLGRAEASALGEAARVHDVGKTRIPLSILAKPGRLDPAEEVQMRTHPEWGLFLIRSGQGTIGETAARIALAHHERWDGTGYPLRTARREIRFEARITAVADAYDALRSPREYKPPRSHDEAMSRIAEAAGTQFDPEVV